MVVVVVVVVVVVAAEIGFFEGDLEGCLVGV